MELFILMIGTKKPFGSDEEYRWAILSRISRFKGVHEYCRSDGKMNTVFVRQCFASAVVYPEDKSAFESILPKIGESSCFVQIEHFPNEEFPDKSQERQ